MKVLYNKKTNEIKIGEFCSSETKYREIWILSSSETTTYFCRGGYISMESWDIIGDF